MKKSDIEFLHRWVDDLRSRQNEIINDLQLKWWKPLERNFDLKAILVKIFDNF